MVSEQGLGSLKKLKKLKGESCCCSKTSQADRRLRQRRIQVFPNNISLVIAEDSQLFFFKKNHSQGFKTIVQDARNGKHKHGYVQHPAPTL